MTEHKHPSELNPYQQYRRSVKVAKSTSRMKCLAWYQDALDLDVQIHCYLKDDSGVDCYLHVKSGDVFEKLGAINAAQLEQRDFLEQFIDDALDHEACRRADSLGVIFYLADDFSLAGLGPEFKNPIELPNLRQKMCDAPKEVLDDKTISTDTHAWRLFPYAGAAAGTEFATAVAVSQHRSETLKMLREIGNDKNFPIRTCGLSAPLCAIGLVPLFATANQEGSVCLFNYHTFTLMAFFNGHGDLMVLRNMPHPNGATLPANIGPAIQATATAFEMEKPDIRVLSMVGNDIQSLPLMLQQSIPGSHGYVINAHELLENHALSTDIPLECIAVTREIDPELYPLAANETFTSLREDCWHVQDFFSPHQEELDMYPDRSDMKILRFGRRIRKIAALVIACVLVYGTFNVFTKVNSDVWNHQPIDHVAESKKLTGEIARFEHWNNLLMDRSKGWVCLELVSLITPADGSVSLRSVKHNVTLRKDGNSGKSGFSKKWVIIGYANELGIEHLEKDCTSDGISKLFLKVAQSTENAAYLPELGQRDITVSLAPRFNPSYNNYSRENAGSEFTRMFTLTITQNITADDVMALVASN